MLILILILITDKLIPIEFPINWLTMKVKDFVIDFLADRTNGRAYATVLRLSSVRLSVCDVMYCG